MTRDDVGVVADVIVQAIKEEFESPQLQAIIDGRVKAVIDECINKALDARPWPHDGGVWKSGTLFRELSMVSHQGSGWICTKTHVAGSEFDHSCFRLHAKRGRDAR